MSNNIYNILGKLKSITDTAALTPDTQPKTVYESVEARGSITEAVKALEAKYKTFKEGSSSYPTDANWDKSGQMDPLAKGTGPSRTRANPKSTARDIDQANFQTKKGITDRLAKGSKAVALPESVADDIADKKAEKEAGDWWGDKKASLNKDKREVKGDKYGGSKQKSDDEDDFKSKKTAILDKDEEEVLDEGFASPAQEAKIRARLEKLHDSGKYEPEVVYEKVAYEFGMTQKQLQDALAGKSLNEYSQAEYDGAMSDFKKKGGQVKQLPAGNAKNPISTASRHIAGKGEAGKGKTAGRGANVTASKPVVDIYEKAPPGQVEEGIVDTVRAANYDRLAKRSMNKTFDVDSTDYFKKQKAQSQERSAKAAQLRGQQQGVAEAFEFDSKNGFKNPAKLSKAPKAKLVKESASMRHHPIYTNKRAWDHYEKEMNEEELNKATQELDEISKLAGLPKPAANTVPPIAPAPVADNNWDDAAWDDESGYDLDDPKHPTWLDRQHDAADLQNDYNKENPAVPAIDESNELDDERDQLQHLMNKYNWSYAEAVEHLNYDEWDPADWVSTRFEEVIDEAEMEEGNEFSGALADAKAAGIKDFEVAGKKYTVKEDINVNVTASGEEDALNLFRKLAGMPQIAIAQNEEPVEVELDERLANAPQEHILPVSAAIPSGNDLHGAKRAYKIAATGDNPMAVAEAKDTSWSKYTGMLKGLLK